MNPFNKFESRWQEEYKLARGGYVRFKASELQSVQPMYENTMVVLENGKSYLLEGRNYGV